MVTVFLHGYLGEKFGKEHKLNISSVSEAIRAFNANYPNKFLKELRKGTFKILNNDDAFQSYADLDMNYDGCYHIVPIPTGSKSGWFQVFVGVVMVVAGVYFQQPWLTTMGVGMMMGGVATMMAPTMGDYSQREDPDERPSYLFNGPSNTVEQGGPVPVIYGRVIVGSKVISAELDIEDIS